VAKKQMAKTGNSGSFGNRPPSPNAGRKKGVPNKLTTSVRTALETAFEKMGGVDSLVKWALLEPTEFYKLYAKLLPVQVNADVTISTTLAERLARAKSAVHVVIPSPSNGEEE
jgi:hypothetical protein